MISNVSFNFKISYLHEYLSKIKKQYTKNENYFPIRLSKLSNADTFF